MSSILTVKNISKVYEIYKENLKYRSLRDDMVKFVRHPFSIFSQRTEAFYALKNISFSLERGETLGIIGGNGAGKSTLLKILSRITYPTKGEIVLKGRVSSLLEVGTGFHPELTGRENIFLSGAVLGMKQYEIKRKFDEIVDFSGIEKFLDTPVKHYSSGMYTRLAFAVAAFLESDILLVDEVLAVGDIDFQKKCLGKMNEISGSGRTIIFVSHNMGAISDLCTKTIRLEKGVIRELGPTAEVVSHYLSEASNKTLSLSQISNTLQDSPLTFTNIKITNSTGTPTSLINFGESFAIHINGVTNQNIESALISLTISSILGHPIYNSQITSKELNLKKTRCKIELILHLNPNVFGSGTYSVSLGLQAGTISIGSSHVITFTISDKKLPYQQYIMYDGYVVYPRRWELSFKK